MRLPQVFQVTILVFGLTLLGCGGKASDGGFPSQIPITPTSGTLNGRIEIPTNTSDQNLSFSINRVRRAVSLYDNLTIQATYVDVTGKIVEVGGIVQVDPGGTGATYVVEDLPFGKELTVVLKRGKITLKATSEPLSPTEDTRAKNVNASSTAETILYEEIKKGVQSTGGSVDFKTQSKSPEFQREKAVLANLILQEMANENIDAASLDLLDRPLLRSEVEKTAKAVVEKTLIDHPPYAVLNRLGEDLSSAIEILIRLYDPENDPAIVNIYYALDGTNFVPATLSSEGLANGSILASERRDGIPHVFVWDSTADLEAGTQQRVTIAVDASPENDPSISNRTKSVEFEVDNRGIPAILSITSSEHLLGQTSTINVQGLNLNVVTQVELEYIGTESFIEPKIFSIDQFSVASPEFLSFNIPAFGPFPVSYRLVLSGTRVKDRALSSQKIEVKELSGPQFSLPNLTPSQGFNHTSQEISFEGRNLMGIFGDRAYLEKSDNPLIKAPLRPDSAILLDAEGLMEWSGVVPSRLVTGEYRILVSNTCNPSTPCGDPVELAINNTTPVIYTVLETSPIINSIVPPPEGVAFNSTEYEIKVLGERLSSVNEVRLSTNADRLVSNFSDQILVSVIDTGYSSLVFRFEIGTPEGQYYVGVRNLSGQTVSADFLQAREGLIPSTSISVDLLDLAQVSLGSTTVSNLTSFIIKLSGISLGSLSEIKMVNQDLTGIIESLEPSKPTSFTEAKISVSKHLPPGRYTLNLLNSAGTSSVNCGGVSCLTITEEAPIITEFENVLIQEDSPTKEVIAGEAGILKIQGENLAGVRSASICETNSIACFNGGGTNPLNYPIGSVSGGFEEVFANLSSSVYMKPGTYFISVTNQTASTFSSELTTRLKVLERTPDIDLIFPSILSTSDFQNSSQVITFTGQNLYGLKTAQFFKAPASTEPCTIPLTQAVAIYDQNHVSGKNRSEAILEIPRGFPPDPGVYTIRVSNETPSDVTDTSACDGKIQIGRAHV